MFVVGPSKISIYRSCTTFVSHEISSPLETILFSMIAFKKRFEMPIQFFWLVWREEVLPVNGDIMGLVFVQILV